MQFQVNVPAAPTYSAVPVPVATVVTQVQQTTVTTTDSSVPPMSKCHFYTFGLITGGVIFLLLFLILGLVYVFSSSEVIVKFCPCCVLVLRSFLCSFDAFAD